MIDILFISPGNNTGIYQELADNYSAIEPPTWSLLLAESCRSIGHKVAIIDANAELLNAPTPMYDNLLFFSKFTVFKFFV